VTGGDLAAVYRDARGRARRATATELWSWEKTLRSASSRADDRRRARLAAVRQELRARGMTMLPAARGRR
jgi:hypothetical protein